MPTGGAPPKGEMFASRLTRDRISDANLWNSFQAPLSVEVTSCRRPRVTLLSATCLFLVHLDAGGLLRRLVDFTVGPAPLHDHRDFVTGRRCIPVAARDCKADSLARIHCCAPLNWASPREGSGSVCGAACANAYAAKPGYRRSLQPSRRFLSRRPTFTLPRVRERRNHEDSSCLRLSVFASLVLPRST